MTDLTDTQFLDYCVSMTETPRCGFAPQTIARLLRLAGDNELADYWAVKPDGIISNIHKEVTELVKRARNRSIAS